MFIQHTGQNTLDAFSHSIRGDDDFQCFGLASPDEDLGNGLHFIGAEVISHHRKSLNALGNEHGGASSVINDSGHVSLRRNRRSTYPEGVNPVRMMKVKRDQG